MSPTVTTSEVEAFAAALGRRPLFAENFPVNDGAMAGVLHLGPYPEREAGVVEATTGVFCNFMSWPLASRVGLGVAARWWRDPRGDREDRWAEVVASIPGIEPLARACRSWVGAAGPDPTVAGWVDDAIAGRPDALRAYLFAGCRAGLDEAWTAELEPWLTHWDFEAQAMQFALALLDARPARPAGTAFLLSELWSRAPGLQAPGLRRALGLLPGDPVTRRPGPGAGIDAAPAALVEGENLTDRLCRAALFGRHRPGRGCDERGRVGGSLWTRRQPGTVATESGSARGAAATERSPGPRLADQGSR